MNYKKIYEEALKIRFFEKKLLDLFDKGLLNGTTHTCIGQEIIPVILSKYLNSNDSVFSNHRGHGHFISYSGKIKELMCEIMGKEGALLSGKGGSQHIHYKNFYSNGILGGMFPIAAGSALAQKIKKNKNLSLVYIGDGAMGEGIIYETLNMISLYKLPIIIILENNKYAQSTPIENNFAGNMKSRFESFGIKSYNLEDRNLIFNLKKIKNVFKLTREKHKPHCLIIETNRHAPHSKGDDTRLKSEINKYKKKDPLIDLEKYIDKTSLNKIQQNAIKYIDDIASECLKKKDITKLQISNFNINHKNNLKNYFEKEEKISNILNNVLRKNLKKNLIFLGQDIKDPYGGGI